MYRTMLGNIIKEQNIRHNQFKALSKKHNRKIS